jgi:hypothetical protein
MDEAVRIIAAASRLCRDIDGNIVVARAASSPALDTTMKVE